MHFEKSRDVSSCELVNASYTQQLDEPTRVVLHHCAEHASWDLQQSFDGYHADVIAD